MNKKKSILLVEDEEITAHMQSKQLEKKGYAVKHLLTGEEAVEYTLKNSPSLDLILMDIDLGDGIYGTDAAKQILEKTDIPIVFLSSHTSPEIVEKAEEITSYGYVIKNAGIVVIDASIKMALRLFEAKKESEQHKNKLKLSEEKYRKLTENTDTILWEFDIIEDKWVHLSPQVERILGYEPEEWTNLEFWTDKLHPDDRSWAVKYCAECTSKGADHSFEYRFRKKNGDYVWLLDDVKVEVKNGEPVKMWGSMIDITERKNAMEALRKSELELKEQNHEYQALNEEYETLNEELQQINEKLAHSRDLMQYIIEHNRSAVAVHDKDLKYIYVSQRYLDEFNINDKNIIGRHHYEVFPDLPQKWRNVHQKALKGIVSSAENDPYYKEDGTVEWTRWECRPWYESDGSIGGFIIYTEVITDRINTEKALQKSEERLDLAMAVKNEGIWDWDLITNETYFDDRYYTMAGYKPGEFSHNFEEWVNRVNPDDLAKAQTAINNYLSGESPIFNIEFRFRKKDGNWMWINGKGKIVERDSSNKPTRIVGTHIDITGQKMAEQALKNSELELKKQNDEYYAINEEYLSINEELNQVNEDLGIILKELEEKNAFIQTILDKLPIGVALNKINEGTATYMNKKFQEIYGWDRDTLKDVSVFFEKVYPDKKYREKIIKQVSDDIKTGDTEKMKWENIEATRKDGSKRIINAVNIPLFEQNTMVSTVMDVTDQKLTEHALRDSEQKYRTLLENAFDGIYLLHGRGFEYVNKQFCNLTGYSYRELMRDNFDFAVLLTDKAKMIVEKRFKDREEGKNLDSVYEFQLKTKKGEVKDVEVSTTSLRGKDMPLILGIIRDITRYKKTQKLEREVLVAKQAAEFKQKFLANMSHEIRTPLSGMLGFVDLLADTSLKEEQRLYVDTLRQSGENLREIINLILDYSKIESGQITLKHKTFALKSVFDDVAGLFSSICHKEIELKTTISRQIPKYINTDRNRLNQILNNLVSNAVKFTEKGTITVNAKLKKPSGQAKLFPETGSVMIKIEVKDTGQGIDPVFQKELFKPFSQADVGEVRSIEGTGLGLSICKELAEMLGGEIGVISKPGKGSNFWFTFETKVAEKPERITDTTKKQEKENEIPACNILLVDDRKINQVVVSLMLKSNGHEVDTANNGKEAVEKYKPGKYDIILMDIQMPVMDGIMATKKLKQKYKKLPPIVGLSANAFEGDREKYMKQGLDEYIIKPIKKEDFDRVVEKLGVGEKAESRE